jgi:hypothetical protein
MAERLACRSTFAFGDSSVSAGWRDGYELNDPARHVYSGVAS